MRTEWIKAIMTQLFALFLFIALNMEIMSWFDEYILPTLSRVNEGAVSSIIFGTMCLSTIVFWIKRFRRHYYVKPIYVLSSITLSSVYWFYRLFTDEYVVTESVFFHIGFSDIIYGGLFLFGIISLFVDLIELNEPAPNETQNEDKAPMLEDRPITRRDQDRLGFGDEVDTLYQRIIERQATTALSIGINARWGDGKSSFINLMEEKFLQNKDSFIVIRFNPRHSTNDTIQSEFFENLYSELSKYDSRFKSSFNDYLRAIDVMADNKYLSALFQTSTLFNRNNEKSRINRAIKRLKKRIIVIIEDLDRLTGDEIVEVFKLIDGNADFDNLIFISAYDKGRINSLLESTDVRTAFSDKFFTWERPLPLRSSQLLLDFLIANLTSGLTFKDEELEEINSSIVANCSFFTFYLKNLRDVKRYINLVKPSLNRIYKEVNIRNFLLIELVRYRYPEEHKTLYEQNAHKDSEINFERKIIIDALEQYKSKDILKVLFPADESSSYRSINSVGGFSIYFQEHLFERVSNEKLGSIFEMSCDYRALIDEILNNKGWNQLNEYLGSLNTLSLQSWDAVVRYIDIYIYLNAHYNERLYSTISVGILIEKSVAERLCKKFEISIINYKSKIYHKLIGSNSEYPHEIVGQQLWAYKRREIRRELIFTENELLTILKQSLRDLIKNKPGYTSLHNEILRACISFIEPDSKKVSLDSEACKMVLDSIRIQPETYLNNFVILAGVSSSPEWNSITCDPFWMQIFGSIDNVKDFIFDTKFDTFLNIERIRNFWLIYEMNDYQPIEFQNQGPVQEKIDNNLVNERKLLNEILEIDSEVNSVSITPENIVSAYKLLKKSLDRLETNTLYIKKRGDIRMSIIEKRDELKLLRESEPLKITQEVLENIQSFEKYINEHLRC